MISSVGYNLLIFNCFLLYACFSITKHGFRELVSMSLCFSCPHLLHPAVGAMRFVEEEWNL